MTKKTTDTPRKMFVGIRPVRMEKRTTYNRKRLRNEDARNGYRYK